MAFRDRVSQRDIGVGYIVPIGFALVAELRLPPGITILEKTLIQGGASCTILFARSVGLKKKSLKNKNKTILENFLSR